MVDVSSSLYLFALGTASTHDRSIWHILKHNEDNDIVAELKMQLFLPSQINQIIALTNNKHVAYVHYLDLLRQVPHMSKLDVGAL